MKLRNHMVLKVIREYWIFSDYDGFRGGPQSRYARYPTQSRREHGGYRGFSVIFKGMLSDSASPKIRYNQDFFCPVHRFFQYGQFVFLGIPKLCTGSEGWCSNWTFLKSVLFWQLLRSKKKRMIGEGWEILPCHNPKRKGFSLPGNILTGKKQRNTEASIITVKSSP